MPYLVPSEVVELLLHRHHPIRILKCFLYPMWLNRGNKRVMLTQMCNTRSSGYPFMNVAKDGVDGVISLDCLVDSWVWRSWFFILSVFWVRPHTRGCPSRCFRSRTVSPTVAKWFVSDARETMDNVYRFEPLCDA
jgi:hypothetical protein